MARLRTLIAPLWPLFALGQVAMFAAAGAGLVFPWAVRGFFGSLLSEADLRSLGFAVAGLAVVLVFKEAAGYARTRILGTLGEKVVHRLREQVYDQLLTRSIGFFRNTVSGDLVSAASNDIEAVRYGIAAGVTGLFQQVLTLAIVIAMLFLLDPPLAAAVLIFVPVVLVISKVMSKRSERTAMHRQAILGEIMSVFQQSIAGIEVIRSFLLEGEARRLYRERNARSFRTSVRAVGITSASSFAGGMAGSVLMVVVMGLGGYRVMTASLTPADLIAFILYSEMVTGPFVALSTILPELARSRASYRRITELLHDLRPDPAMLEESEGAGSTPCGGALRFESVGFSYDGRHEALSHVSFFVEPGETVALIGPSGAGKSTVTRLVTRLYDPCAGVIRLGGTDIREIDVGELRKAVGIVPQDPFLFDMSILENIACGKVTASEGEIRDAARRAGVSEFADRLERGLDTLVGDSGARLSGGQRQRIAIARAFLKDPVVLLLDEATSALDGVSEAVVREALERLRQGRTTLIIAHNPSTFRTADRIVVLDQGCVAAMGTHDELIEQSSLYRSLAGAGTSGVHA